MPLDAMKTPLEGQMQIKARTGVAPGGAERSAGPSPETGEPIYVKTGRYGDYVQLGDPSPVGEGRKRSTKSGKPKMASLWPSMDRGRLTLDEAVLVLSFPREIGDHPDTGEPVTVQDGRYVPYVRSGKESRSLEGHEPLTTLTLEQAVEILGQPKPKRRGGAAAPVLKELGVHPQKGLEISVRKGRFGHYVTDGEVNAALPKGRSPQEVELGDAVELLLAREEKLSAQGKDSRAPKRRPGAKAASRSVPGRAPAADGGSGPVRAKPEPSRPRVRAFSAVDSQLGCAGGPRRKTPE